MEGTEQSRTGCVSGAQETPRTRHTWPKPISRGVRMGVNFPGGVAEEGETGK